MTLFEFVKSIRNVYEEIPQVDVFCSVNDEFPLDEEAILPRYFMFSINIGKADDCLNERYAKAVVTKILICDNRRVRVLIGEPYIEEGDTLAALNLPKRVTNPFVRRGMKRISDITAMSIEELTTEVTKRYGSIRALGEKGLKELIDAVHGLGLTFKDE